MVSRAHGGNVKCRYTHEIHNHLHFVTNGVNENQFCIITNFKKFSGTLSNLSLTHHKCSIIGIIITLVSKMRVKALETK